MKQLACHDCDLVIDIGPLPAAGKALCPRCGAVVVQRRKDSIDRTLAWTIAGLVLYIVSVSYPFLAMRSGSIVRETAMLSGVQQLYSQGELLLATIVTLTCLVVPLVQMLILSYLFLPLKFNRRVRYAIPVFRVFSHCRPWSMMEIYLLGILVAMVKLAKMATIIPGLASVAFAMLVVVLTCAVTSIDEHQVWHELEETE